MPYSNVHRGVRMSPKKVQPVIALIRGKRVDEATTLMRLSKKRAAVFILQSILAARANAEHAEVDVRRLVIVDARVDSGPTMKRFQPKDRGRSHKILKRSSHITVAVEAL